MPISKKNKKRYPKDWGEISRSIKADRAGWRCECTGECRSIRHTYHGRCKAFHGYAHPETGSKVVLTVAHLDHQPENCTSDNLKAMCQACHLSYDADHHRKSRRESKAAKSPNLEFPFADGG